MEKVGLAALRDDKEAFQILPVAVDEGPILKKTSPIRIHIAHRRLFFWFFFQFFIRRDEFSWVFFPIFHTEKKLFLGFFPIFYKEKGLFSWFFSIFFIIMLFSPLSQCGILTLQTTLLKCWAVWWKRSRIGPFRGRICQLCANFWPILSTLWRRSLTPVAIVWTCRSASPIGKSRNFFENRTCWNM